MLASILSWFMDISSGVGNVFQLGIFIAALLGVLVGVIIGVLPGLGPAVAISLAIPITFGMDPLIGMAVMLGIYKGGTYGGSISAILINTPGTPAAAATVLDGFPMSTQGKAGKALDIALYASCFGDAFSIMLLSIVAQPIAFIATRFGPIELFSLLLFAMTVVAGLAGKSLAKGLSAAAIGLAMSMIGLDPVDGLPRFTFHSIVLEGGLGIIPMVVGLFAISEQMSQAAVSSSMGARVMVAPPKEKTDAYCTLPELKRCLPIFVRSSALGAIIGALPGTGSTTASFLGYGMQRSRSKQPELFGKGSYEGVAAAESANNAVCGGALIPMLALGIPGDVITAILMGALMLHGIQVGPSVFSEHRVFIFTLFGILLVSIVMLLILGKLCTRVCRHLAELPASYITTVVLLLCVAGIYSVGFSMSDVWMMMVFGIIGFVMLRLDVPLPPMIIAFIIAPSMEQSLRQAMLISSGDASVLFTHPISAFFLALTLFAVVRIVLSNRRKSRLSGEG